MCKSTSRPVERDGAGARHRENAVDQVGAEAGVIKAEWKRCQIRAFELRAFIAHRTKGAAAGALMDDAFLLMAADLPRLGKKYVTSAFGAHDRGSRRALLCLESEGKS